MHFLIFVIQALCITGSLSSELCLVFFMNAEITFVVFVLENCILSFWFSILKTGGIKPVRCMKTGVIRSNCENNGIVVEIRTALSNLI